MKQRHGDKGQLRWTLDSKQKKTDPHNVPREYPPHCIDGQQDSPHTQVAKVLDRQQFHLILQDNLILIYILINKTLKNIVKFLHS